MGQIFLTRPLVPADWPQALALTQEQRWSHQRHDWELALQLGRGFGAVDARGMLAGTAMWWANGAGYGTAGLIVVRNDCQGQGLGRRLIEALFADSGARSLGLVATQAGLKLYRDTGFVECGGIEQWQGTIDAPPAPKTPTVGRARALQVEDLDMIVAQDQKALGAPRTELLRAVWNISQQGLALEHAGTLRGFCLWRPAGAGTTIGPLIASDETVAMQLAITALAQVRGVARLDIPQSALTLAGALRNAGLRCVDRVTAMIRGAPPQREPPWQRFGLVSQAYG